MDPIYNILYFSQAEGPLDFTSIFTILRISDVVQFMFMSSLQLLQWYT
jgi:hypothetical protein